MKIAVNRCWGGFMLSEGAVLYYAKLKGIELYPYVNKKKKNGLIDFEHLEPYINQNDIFSVTYFTSPLNEFGDFNNDLHWSYRDIERNDPFLVQTIEDLGTERASGDFGAVGIVEIPDDVRWVISDYDGMETVEEEHRSW